MKTAGTRHTHTAKHTRPCIHTDRTPRALRLKLAAAGKQSAVILERRRSKRNRSKVRAPDHGSPKDPNGARKRNVETAGLAVARRIVSQLVNGIGSRQTRVRSQNTKHNWIIFVSSLDACSRQHGPHGTTGTTNTRENCRGREKLAHTTQRNHTAEFVAHGINTHMHKRQPNQKAHETKLQGAQHTFSLRELKRQIA